MTIYEKISKKTKTTSVKNAKEVIQAFVEVILTEKKVTIQRLGRFIHKKTAGKKCFGDKIQPPGTILKFYAGGYAKNKMKSKYPPKIETER